MLLKRAQNFFFRIHIFDVSVLKQQSNVNVKIYQCKEGFFINSLISPAFICWGKSMVETSIIFVETF